MGRRALKKIDDELDLSRHFHTLETLPRPWSQEAVFGRTAPLEVEMGSGKGLFLQNAAQRIPERNFLGVEVSYKYARYSAARLARRGLDNGCCVHGDGLKMFREILPDGCAMGVHVYFPDPWWKARHKKRRVLNEAFLEDAARVLCEGGRLHFWTDVQEYYETTLELIAQFKQFEGPLSVEARPAEHDLDYHTHFERRTRLAGEPVYRSEFLRRSNPDAA
ncbi:MAG: tRNA (guanosine(46)-N7)-methyltransferase TrmB [Planctomycetales bacterium]|nr:tRNA (guanosine(46)-N7)-methyltransferase TrmB [Planctomycetales bacterium]